MRAELLERYRALPMPTTQEEAWRFTDLKGFDPDALASNGHVRGSDPGTMLALDVSGRATVTAAGVEIESAPEGIRFEPLGEGHERLGQLVGTDEKFAAHNAALWEHGLLVHVPGGVELSKPLYVRVSVPFWRLLVIADEGSRFSLVEEYASPALADAYSSTSEKREPSSATTSSRQNGTETRT